MQQLILSQSSVFYLQKIAHDVHADSGVRYKISNESSMLNLLKAATLSKNRLVKEDLNRFASDLDKAQIKTLMSHGVVLRN